MMNVEILRNYCLEKQSVTESFPFDEATLVFKVLGKMFALMPLESISTRMNLKCDPERALELREEYAGIKPGYHMNKKHWNTVMIDDTIPSNLVKELIDHSYELVVKKMKKADRIALGFK